MAVSRGNEAYMTVAPSTITNAEKNDRSNKGVDQWHKNLISWSICVIWA